jgi:endonuclease III
LGSIIDYIEEAEQSYESDFENDRFLSIKGVSFKTRDLALSEFSDRFVAVDLHVVRVTARTGVLLHGYGDPRVTTDPSKAAGYLFFHDLILKLSRQTGWPEAGHSPGEIDRMLWNFGRAVCRAAPRCDSCPITAQCLTAMARRSME